MGRVGANYTFVHGAALLAAAGLVSRLVGGLARIPLTRLLGGEGMGLFQMAYVIFTMAITFAIAGITVATSRMVAECAATDRMRDAEKIFGLSLLVALTSGLGFWLLLDRGAVLLAGEVLGDERAAAVIRAIAPSVIPVSLIASLKGYFQGLQAMGPPSSSQVVEQVLRVGAMMWLVFSLRSEGLETAVAGAAWGNMVGATAALLMLLILFARRPKHGAAPAAVGRVGDRGGGDHRRLGARRARSRRSFFGLFMSIALPVTLGAAMLPLMDAVQTFLVPGRLQTAGIDPRQVTYLYGQLHGMAYPLAGLPAIVASAMAAALVPAITEALAKGRPGEVAGRTDAALRLTVTFSLPAAVGLFILAAPINEMLFGIPEAGVPLMYVCPACVFIALQQTSAGVLQGLGKVSVPLYGLTGGLLANAATTYFLAAVPRLNINGAALAIDAGFLVATLVNLVVVAGDTRAGRDLAGLVVKPAAAAAAMGLVTSYLYSWVRVAAGAGNTVATVVAVGAGVVSYGLALLVVGGVGESELRHIPVVGPRLAGLFRKR